MFGSIADRSLNTATMLLIALTVCERGTASSFASFRGIGDLPGGAFFTQVNDVSADGTTVVGSSFSDVGEEAFSGRNRRG